MRLYLKLNLIKAGKKGYSFQLSATDRFDN